MPFMRGLILGNNGARRLRQPRTGALTKKMTEDLTEELTEELIEVANSGSVRKQRGETALENTIGNSFGKQQWLKTTVEKCTSQHAMMMSLDSGIARSARVGSGPVGSDRVGSGPLDPFKKVTAGRVGFGQVWSCRIGARV